MGQSLIKLIDPLDQKEYWLVWSTVVDAPITYGLSLDELREYWREEYGRSGMDGLERSIELANETGFSSRIRKSLEDVICANHAADDGSELTLEQIIQKYCRDRPADDDEPTESTHSH